MGTSCYLNMCRWKRCCYLCPTRHSRSSLTPELPRTVPRGAGEPARLNLAPRPQSCAAREQLLAQRLQLVEHIWGDGQCMSSATLRVVCPFAGPAGLRRCRRCRVPGGDASLPRRRARRGGLVVWSGRRRRGVRLRLQLRLRPRMRQRLRQRLAAAARPGGAPLDGAVLPRLLQLSQRAEQRVALAAEGEHLALLGSQLLLEVLELGAVQRLGVRAHARHLALERALLDGRLGELALERAHLMVVDKRE